MLRTLTYVLAVGLAALALLLAGCGGEPSALVIDPPAADSVVVTVLDYQDNPVLGATVNIRGQMATGEVHLSGTTGSNGKVTIANVPSMDSMMVEAYRSILRTTSDGPRTATVALKLPQPGASGVYLVTVKEQSDGTLVSGATVDLGFYGWGGFVVAISGTTDANGVAAFFGPDNDFSVRVTKGNESGMLWHSAGDPHTGVVQIAPLSASATRRHR